MCQRTFQARSYSINNNKKQHPKSNSRLLLSLSPPSPYKDPRQGPRDMLAIYVSQEERSHQKPS